MSAQQSFIHQMKENLLKRRTVLQTLLTNANEHSDELQVKDSGDEATAASIDSLRNSLTQSDVEEFNQIEAALARIERNEFGLCIDCGDHIAEKRLTYSPFAARCIICQEEVEQAK